MAVRQIEPRSVARTFVYFLLGDLGLPLTQRHIHQQHLLALGKGSQLSIWVHSRREDEHYRSILVGVSIDALEGRVRRMDEGLVAILVDDKVNECWDHSIPPDDLGDDQLAKTIAFFVPLARQGLLLGIGRHVPLLPLLGVVDESPDYVGEVGQFLKIADGVPAGRVDPLVGIHGLSLAINAEILSSLEEEVVLLHIDFFQPDRHHKS